MGGADSVGKTGGGGSTKSVGVTGGSDESGGSRASGGAAGLAGRSSGSGGRTASTGGSTGKGGNLGGGGRAGSTGLGGSATGGRADAGGGTSRDGGLDAAGSEDGSAGRGGAGGQSSVDAAGSGGSSPYNPCPTNGDPCKILPLGDSITHGLNSSDDGGYRSRLFELVVAANQNVTFLGTLSNGPSKVSGKDFPKNHDGHDGWTVEPGFSQYDTQKNQGVSLLVSTDKAFKTIPHIVLLHIGTNDLTSSSSKSTTSDRLDSLLTKIAGLAPDGLVVVAKIIPLGYSSSDWDNYNAKIPTIVQAHAAKGQHVISVDMSKLASNQLNGVHPTDQGYTTMAKYWFEAIKEFLPK